MALAFEREFLPGTCATTVMASKLAPVASVLTSHVYGLELDQT